MPLNNKSIMPALWVALFILAFTGAGLLAQSSNDDWQVLILPYGLFANIEGEAAVGRTDPVPVDVSFGQILENLQIGGMLHSEVHKGSWGVVLDFAFMALGTSSSIAGGPAVLDADVDQLVLEAFLSYRKPLSRGWIEAYGGIRYWDLDVNLGLRSPLSDGSFNLRRGESWTDPVIGTRLRHDFTDKAFLLANGDIGGFGVSSDFSWNLQGGLGYDLSKRLTLIIQYRSLSVDFDNGKQGTPEFLAYDTNTHGPLIGLGFRF